MITCYLLSLALASGQSFAQDITSDLEAWYTFDYSNGSQQVIDHSGNERHITSVKGGQVQPLDGDYEWNTDEVGGETRPYVYFAEGRDGNVWLSNAPGNNWLGLAGQSARTVCAWVRIDVGANDFTGRILYGYGTDASVGGRYQIALKGRSIEFENAANTAANGWSNRSVTNLDEADFPQGQWFHLALVYDGQGDRQTGLKLYLNGRQRALSPVASSADFSIQTALAHAPVIGQYMEKMAIADLRVYNRALSEADIGLFSPDTTDPEDRFTISYLREMLQLAVLNGSSQIIVPPGTYTDPMGNNSSIFLQHAENLDIIADDVLMLCGKRTRALELSGCKNVTIRGLTIDYAPLPFTQGDIVALGQGYVDVKIHRGYPLSAFSRIDIIDSQTHYRKRGSTFLWGATATFVGDSIVRVSQADLPSVAEIGDMASMSTGADPGGAPHALVISNCEGGITLDRVTVHSAPGFGIFESGGMGDTHLTHCRVVPGPMPEGASHERLLSASWDAIQHLLTRKGPVVEHCEVRDAGDDSWSVTWNGAFTIQSAGGNTITVAPDNDGALPGALQIGDSLRSSLTSEAARITAISGGSIQLDRPSPWEAGIRVYSPSRRCEDFILRHNHFRSSGRVLIKAGNGVIEHNFFEDTHSGVTVNTEIAPGATGVSNLIIRNNRIKGTGHFMPAPWSNQAGAISIADGSGSTLSPAGPFSDILIQENSFDDVSGVNVVISSAKHVQLVKNEFHRTGSSHYDHTGQAYQINQRTVVYLKNCQDVLLDSNAVVHSGLDALLDTVGVTGLQRVRRGIFDTSVPYVFRVSIASPSSLAVVPAQEPVTLTANADYSDGSIAKVAYYVDNDLIGEQAAAPYTIQWTPAAVGVYEIVAKATAADGTIVVSDRLTLTVSENETPANDLNPRNLFTPNGDGKNDFWEIEGISQHPDLDVRVYNAVGQQVYHAKPYQPWYGTFNGTVVPTGVYHYRISRQQQVIKTGSLTIIP